MSLFERFKHTFKRTPAKSPIRKKRTVIEETQGGETTMKKVTLIVTGRVQGVGFRYMTKMVADQIGIFGLVRNEMDGSVYIEANGDPQKVDAFIEEIRKSPTPSGKVEHLVITENPSLPVKDKFSVSN